MPCCKEVLNIIYHELDLVDWKDLCVCASLQFPFVVTYHWLNVHQAAREGLAQNFLFQLLQLLFVKR